VDEALRFLEMVRRELGARDVRIEFGLEPPSPVLATVPIGPQGAYLVAHFDGASSTDTATARERHAELLASFETTAEGAVVELVSVRPSAPPARLSGPAAALTEALESLAQLARAELALVIDDASPEIWGGSDPALTQVSSDDAVLAARLDARLDALGLSLAALVAKPEEARAAIDAAGIGSHERDSLLRQLRAAEDLSSRVAAGRWLRVAHAIAGARGLGGTHLGLSEVRAHVRAFAGIYRVILVYEGPFSELHAEGALVRALPVIEKLVTALPPRDPVSGGAKVAVLRRLRRV
jgi:hypothetical protein